MKEIKPHIKKVKGKWCVININDEVVSKEWSIFGLFELAVRWCRAKNKELGIQNATKSNS